MVAIVQATFEYFVDVLELVVYTGHRMKYIDENALKQPYCFSS